MAKYAHLNEIVQKYVIFIHFHTNIQKYAKNKITLGIYIYIYYFHPQY